MIRLSVIGVLFTFFFSISCQKKSGKSTGKSDSLRSEKPVKTAEKTRFAEWPQPFWTAKAKVNVQHPSLNVSFQISLRCEKDASLWFSAQALGLFEVARGKINRDSMLVHDKINNRCLVGDLSMLENYVPFPLGIKQLQHFLMGRVFWDSLYVEDRRQVEDSTFISGSQGDFWYAAAIGQQYFLARAEAKSEETRAKVLLQNQLFKAIGSTMVAFKKEIFSSQLVEGKPQDSRIQIEFTRFEFVAQRPEMELNIPADCSKQVLH